MWRITNYALVYFDMFYFFKNRRDCLEITLNSFFFFKRHVLTAAHCVINNATQLYYKVRRLPNYVNSNFTF